MGRPRRAVRPSLVDRVLDLGDRLRGWDPPAIPEWVVVVASFVLGSVIGFLVGWFALGPLLIGM